MQEPKMPSDTSLAAPAEETPPAEGGHRDPQTIRAAVIDTLKTIYDPEIPVDIYELGLIYEVDVDEEGDVRIRMTLTSPMCPVAGSLPPEVESRVSAVPGVRRAGVDVVWDPPWDPSRMSEAARLELGML